METKKIFKIKRLLNSDGFLRATINIRKKKSAINNKIYNTIYLIHNKNGRKKAIYIPRNLEEKVKKWVENYNKLKFYLDEISDIYLKKIINRNKKFNHK